MNKHQRSAVTLFLVVAALSFGTSAGYFSTQGMSARGSAMSAGLIPLPFPFPYPSPFPFPMFLPKPLDTNGDGKVSPIDVLIIINWLNDPTKPTTVPPAPANLDVNGDGIITPNDALIIINWINTPYPLSPFTPSFP